MILVVSCGVVQENPAENPLITWMRRVKCRDQFMYLLSMQ